MVLFLFNTVIYVFFVVMSMYMKYVNGRQTGLVTFCVETAFYKGLLKERYKGG